VPTINGAGLAVFDAWLLWIGSTGCVSDGLGVADGVALEVGDGVAAASGVSVGAASAAGASAGTPAMIGFSAGAKPLTGWFGA
jgi:hypothetical protein